MERAIYFVISEGHLWDFHYKFFTIHKYLMSDGLGSHFLILSKIILKIYLKKKERNILKLNIYRQQNYFDCLDCLCFFKIISYSASNASNKPSPVTAQLLFKMTCRWPGVPATLLLLLLLLLLILAEFKKYRFK